MPFSSSRQFSSIAAKKTELCTHTHRSMMAYKQAAAYRCVLRARKSLVRGLSGPSLSYSSVPKAKPEQCVPDRPPTIPPPKIHRVTYEYPPPPRSSKPLPKESSAWRRHFPLFIGVGGLLWGVYAFNYFFGEGGSPEQTILSPTSFTTFRITWKEDISDDTAIIELSPKYADTAKLLKSGSTIWNGKRIWSIQIKHPMIQIARNYTPLPLYYMKSERSSEKPLLRMIGAAVDEGRMCLLVRRYADGEMSRYIHSLPVGSDIEVRGPFVDYQFPYGPEDMQKPRQPMLDVPTRMPAEPELDSQAKHIAAGNIAMFTAGTGITVPLQVLLSPNNPPRGFTSVYHSARKWDDIPLERFQLFLESAGRAKFRYFVDNENRKINLADIPEPVPRTEKKEIQLEVTNPEHKRYSSVVQQFADTGTTAYSIGVDSAIVCGPPGYISYLAGDPGYDGSTPIAGLLGQKGWTKHNTFRLNDL